MYQSVDYNLGTRCIFADRYVESARSPASTLAERDRLRVPVAVVARKMVESHYICLTSAPMGQAEVFS